MCEIPTKNLNSFFNWHLPQHCQLLKVRSTDWLSANFWSRKSHCLTRLFLMSCHNTDWWLDSFYSLGIISQLNKLKVTYRLILYQSVHSRFFFCVFSLCWKDIACFLDVFNKLPIMNGRRQTSCLQTKCSQGVEHRATKNIGGWLASIFHSKSIIFLAQGTPLIDTRLTYI